MQAANLPRCLESDGGFHEIWYAKLNVINQDKTQPALSLWIRFTLLALRDGSKKVAENWAIFSELSTAGKVQSVAIKESHHFEEFRFSPEDGLAIAGCTWSNNSTHGRLRSVDQEIFWNLTFESAESGINSQPFEHVPMILSKLHASSSSVVTPNLDLRFSGVIEVKASGQTKKTFSCHSEPGMQGHISGKRNAYEWAWAHATVPEKKGTLFCFELLTVKPRLCGFVFPSISALCLQWEGKRYEFNKLTDLVQIQSKYSMEVWDFRAKRHDLHLTGRISSHAGLYTGVSYEDTDGSSLYCHNTKFASLKIDVVSPKHSSLHCNNTCAFEIVSRAKDPRIEFKL